MRVIYHPDAESESIDAARYYEKKLPTLGAQFLDAVGKIQQNPTRWKVVKEDVRRFMLSRFPYAIYFRVTGDSLRLLAFKHHSRHPDYWQYRLAE